jgi:hypothetical protein
VSHEYNYVLNPLHPVASRITIVDARNYQYDERYKRIMKAWHRRNLSSSLIVIVERVRGWGQVLQV